MAVSSVNFSEAQQVEFKLFAFPLRLSSTFLLSMNSSSLFTPLQETHLLKAFLLLLWLLYHFLLLFIEWSHLLQEVSSVQLISYSQSQSTFLHRLITDSITFPDTQAQSSGVTFVSPFPQSPASNHTIDFISATNVFMHPLLSMITTNILR